MKEDKNKFETELQKIKRELEQYKWGYNKIKKGYTLLYSELKQKEEKLEETFAEEHKLKELLKESESKYRRLFETSQESILILNAKTGVIEDSNLFIQQLLGYSAKELIGKQIWQISPLKDIISNKRKLIELQKKKYVRYENLPLETKSGKKVLVEFISNVYELNDNKIIQCNIRDITERKKNEEALTKYKFIIEQSTQEMALADLNGKLLFVNEAWAKNHGYTKKELIGKPLKICHAQKELTNVNKDLKILMKKGNHQSEVIHKRKDGSTYPTLMNNFLLNVDGKPKYIVGMAADITYRKKEEEALKESEGRFRELFDNMEECVAIYDIKDKDNIIIKNINKSAEKIEHVKKEDIIGKKVDVVFKGVKEFGLYDVFLQVWKTGKSRHHPISFYKDKYHQGWRENWIYKLPTGEIVAIYSDITEKKIAEDKLKESEQKFSSLLNSTAEAIYGTDQNDNCTICNKACLKILGYTNINQLIGKNMHHLMHHSSVKGKKILQKDCKIYQSLRQGKDHHDINEVFWRADGTCFPVEYWSYPIIVNGEKTGSVVTFFDITERKRIEEALNKSELKFRRLFEAAQDAILIINTHTGKIEDSNPYVQNILGYSAKELIGKQLWQISPLKDIVANKKKFIELQQKKYVHYENLPLENKSGKKCYVEFVSNVYGINGDTVVQCNIRDITDRQKAQQELSKAKEELERRVVERTSQLVESEERFKTLFDMSRDAVMTLAPPTWKFTSGNEATLKMFNIKDETKFISLGPYDLSPKMQPDGQLSSVKAKKMIEKAMTEGSNYFEWTHKRLNDGDFIATVLLSRIISKGKTFLQATVRDITLQKKNEQEIINSKNELSKKVEELETFNRITVGRELKMIELKKKIERLEAQIEKTEAQVDKSEKK